MFAASLAGAAPATARPFAPLDQAGPKLTVPKHKLRASVRCSGGIRDADSEPVLLLPATGVNSEQNFGWNYEPAFAMTDTPYCTSDQPVSRDGGSGGPDSNLRDIQRRGQYVTYAIRRVNRLAGRPIATLGHSQGGMVMRWSLRFWPDTRERVADVIGMAGSNHGTEMAERECPEGCPAANAQQASNSRFIKALNSRAETFRGIAYTELYTQTDEVVTPNGDDSGSSSLRRRKGKGRVANIAVQEVCPGHSADHFTIGTSDPVAYALVVDALEHPGPASKRRFDDSVCLETTQPGVNPITGPAAAAAAAAALAANNAAVPMVEREPKLKRYVFKRRR